MVTEVPNITTAPRTTGVLAGIRVLDVSGPEGMYGGRLLADLGADVVRAETQTQAHDHLLPPVLHGPDGEPVSAFERFVNLNKRSLLLDDTDGASDALIATLASHADVVLTDGTPHLADLPTGTARVDISTFGTVGAGRDLVGDDLVGLAAGGLLSLGGYPDTEPIAVFGNQSLLVGGLLAAVAALLAILARDADEDGRHVDVSVQAGIVGALEDATAEADLRGTARTRAGETPREAGTGTFHCADGAIAMVAGKMGTARAWDALVTWLQDEQVPGADELAEPGWATLQQRRRPDAIATFTRVFGEFSGRHNKAWLYREGQRRGIAVAPVNTISDLLQDDQLRSRDYFRTVHDAVLQVPVTYPGPAFRMYGYPRPEWRSAPRLGADSAAVLDEWLPKVEAAANEAVG